MKFDPRIQKVIEEMKAQGRHCGLECAASHGVCIGKASADSTRPIVVFGAEGNQIVADLTQRNIQEIPKECPFFTPTVERNG